MAACHTSRCLCHRQACAHTHTHTHTETSLLLTHTTDCVSLSPCHTTPGPTSLCPLSLPLHQHLPLSLPLPSVCVCVYIHVRVYWSVSAHTSLSHLKYGRVCLACISWLVPSAENLGRCWWKKHHHKERSMHSMTFVQSIHALLINDSQEKDAVPNRRRLCLSQE